MKKLSKCLLIPPKPNKYSPEANSTDLNQMLFSSDTIISKDSGIIKVRDEALERRKAVSELHCFYGQIVTLDL